MPIALDVIILDSFIKPERNYFLKKGVKQRSNVNSLLKRTNLK